MSRSSDIAEVYKDTAGEYRYRILARNSEIIAEGEGYLHKKDRLDVLEQHFADVAVVDMTLSEPDSR